MKIAVQLPGLRACLPVTLALLTLVSGCAQHPVDSFTAKRAYLNVETRSTGSEYASLGYSQEPVISAIPVQPFPTSDWQVAQTETVAVPETVDIEPIPISTPVPVSHKKVIHRKPVHRHVAHKSPAPMCPPEKPAGAAS